MFPEAEFDLIEGRDFRSEARFAAGSDDRLPEFAAELVRLNANLIVTQGARAIQVFDSWVGALGPDDYVRYVAPYSRALIERIRTTGVPVIHFGTGAAGPPRASTIAGISPVPRMWSISGICALSSSR